MYFNNIVTSVIRFSIRSLPIRFYRHIFSSSRVPATCSAHFVFPDLITTIIWLCSLWPSHCTGCLVLEKILLKAWFELDVVYGDFMAQRRTENATSKHFLHRPHLLPNLTEICSVVLDVKCLFLRHVVYRIRCIDRTINCGL
jgi:hypothetical protein